jgi:large subunit ribosomal protein L7Ae
MMPKAEVTKELNSKVLQLVEVVKNSGKIRKGTNETTKTVERGKSHLVVIANDVEPPEVVMHLPALCDEKKIPYVYVQSKLELGRAAGIDVPTAAISIIEIGDGKDLLKEVLKSMQKE